MVGPDPLVGGHPALDLLNTLEDRGGDAEVDFLPSPGALQAFGARLGLLAAEAPATAEPDHDAPARAELAAAKRFRERLHRIVAARLAGSDPDPADLAALATEAAAAYRAGELKPAADGTLAWQWSTTDLATVRHAVAVAAVDLLATQTDRIKRCPGDECGWVFLDTTKRGNRRWCSMATCGQEAKLAARRRAGTTPSA
jgi:predicted RNA-binding Zn ribbon-like protein